MITVLHPTAGYIPDIAGNAGPGLLSDKEKDYLRGLAFKVAEIAANPKQEKTRRLWYKHNRLEKVTPRVLVFPEDSWIDIIGEDCLRVKDLYWKSLEWYLQHLIYRNNKMMDDFVIEPDLYVLSVVNTGSWGLEANYKSGGAKGSYVWDAPIKEPEDIKKLTYPTIKIDEIATKIKFEATGETFADILPVKVHCGIRLDANLISTATNLRGIEQIMIDMYDRPGWVHKLMEFITEGTLGMLNFLEENNYLSLNNRNHYVDAGGIGYTDELPGPDFDGEHVRFKDMWGYGVAQEFSEISPAMHDEFLLDYQMRILKNYGINSYGCCEPYTNKFDMLKKIPRLRRISVSPWCDIEKAAEKLEDKYIFSWKPNPAMILGEFNPDSIRISIRRVLEVAKDCVLEIIHKDTFTIDKDPNRLETWVRIVKEEIKNAGY